ncbi:MAG TPA: peptidoglycan DD-metalloendopeptidase family protein [Solirubrobacterales bacterium]|jgi:murein DD-endopeptidase MepM/ murein hydrolase activator NlpD|nr:peptidoglycan DD-metalloendopeptidase family protein [Solirubrobacterales bacterium]
MLQIRTAPAALLAAAAALIVLLLSSTPASAQDLSSKLEARESKLSHVRERAGVLTTTISHYRDQIERLTGEVASLHREEADVRRRLDAKQAELDDAVAELDVAKKHLEVVRARLKRALVTLRRRLVAIYETGTPDMLSVIVGARGYDELIDRTEYLERIHSMDEAVIDRVQQLRDQVQSTVRRLRSAKLRIEAARDAIAAERDALATARSALQKRQTKLVAARRDREAALAKINEHEQHLEGEVGEIQAEIAAQLAPSGSLPAGPIRYGSGQLIWPVDGAVVSGFGMRWGRMHEGIDIAVPEGTPIRAADAGTVVLVQSESESGGYGNFTCLDHGGGLQTCYAHQSSVAVSAGQSVSQGQVIGYSGCTGHCFGPHVHFEVRIGGVPTDPLGYL